MKQLFLYKLLTTLFLIFSIVSILWVNYQIVSTWFGKNGPANLGSIEVSYVSMGRFLVDFGPPIGGFGSSWAPFWYLGFPFHLFYTPFLPMLEAFLHKIFHIELWESYRLFTGVAYILGPISAFFLGLQLSKRVIGGLVSGLFYSVGPTLFYFIDSGVAGDRFSSDFWDPRRFTILVRWGEGPHIVSLLFVPLVGVFFAQVIQKRNFLSLFLCSLFLGLAALSNAIGLFSSILLIISMTFVKLAQDTERKKNTAYTALLTGILALGLISFWYNLSFITNFFGEGEGVGKMYLSLFPWGWIEILIGIIALFFLFKKVIRNFEIASSFLWFFILFAIVGVYYLSAPAVESYRRIELLPQALRYMVEVDLSFSVLIGVIFVAALKLVEKKFRLSPLVTLLIGIVIIIGSLWYAQPFIATAKKEAGKSIDVTKTSEYRIASYLSNLVDEKKGERVFIPGNYGFYLNYFTNIWQLRGGLFQASTHYWPDHIHYQMANGRDRDIVRAWLVAINAKYAIVTTPASQELYREIKNLDRFSDFTSVHEEGGDIIYAVPLKRPSMAKPVDISQIEHLAAPQKADDKERLLSYAEWVENSSENETDFEIINNDTYKISGKIGEGEAILVQMTGDSGWRAINKKSQKRVTKGKDPLGFLVLYPSPEEVEIVLSHGATWKQWLGYFVSFGTIAFIIWYWAIGAKKYPVFSKAVSSKKIL